MTKAICFNCGEDKFGPFAICGHCQVDPRSEDALPLSLALSEHLSSPKELDDFSFQIICGIGAAVSPDLLLQAQLALKDPQLIALLGYPDPSSGKPSPVTIKKTVVTPQPTKSAPANVAARSLSTSELHSNPFMVLGATTRDDRSRIVELADEKSFEIDHAACQKARADLTNPRNRLTAEVAWLPGVSPRKAASLADQLLRNPVSMRHESGLPPLAHANLMAAAFEAVETHDAAADIASFILELGNLVDMILPEDVLRDINEDRAVSKIPEVQDLSQVEAELVDRNRYFRNAIKEALNRLPPTSLLEVMTLVADSATHSGKDHAPALIDELIDSYEVETQEFLEREGQNISKLIKTARDSAKAGEGIVRPIIERLLDIARNWDRVAQPIQLSAQARGLDHDPSIALAFSLRSLAIDLFNDHDMVTQATRITAVLQQLFRELPSFIEHLERDKGAYERFERRKADEQLLVGIFELCAKTMQMAKDTPTTGTVHANSILNQRPALLAALKEKNASANTLGEASDAIALAAMSCTVQYGNSTEEWAECVALFDRTMAIANSQEAKEQIAKNASVAKHHAEMLGDLTPVKSVPGLRTVNGCGFTLYGATDPDPRNGSHIATYYFVILAIPLFPIARYRVIQNGNSYRFIGKAPLRTFDKWHIAATCIAILFFMSNM